mmetsp:Transcript_17883/g.46248  ORF Transcript_17883/g.46248 Transcript_17883/m.46248 type:complete len:226 (-) Transcript_17883:520-1197(-)
MLIQLLLQSSSSAESEIRFNQMVNVHQSCRVPQCECRLPCKTQDYFRPPRTRLVFADRNGHGPGMHSSLQSPALHGPPHPPWPLAARSVRDLSLRLPSTTRARRPWQPRAPRRRERCARQCPCSCSRAARPRAAGCPGATASSCRPSRGSPARCRRCLRVATARRARARRGRASRRPTPPPAPPEGRGARCTARRVRARQPCPTRARPGEGRRRSGGCCPQPRGR